MDNRPRSRRSASEKRIFGLPRWLALVAILVTAGLTTSLAWGWYHRLQIKDLERQLASAERTANWRMAESVARELALREPLEFDPWQSAAKAALQQNRPQTAVQYLLEMPEGAPLQAYLQLGYLQMEALQDPLATKATLEKTLQYYPEDPETHARLLYFYTMTGQRNKISAEANRALKRGCDTPATYAYLFGAKWLTFTNGYDTNQRWLQNYPGHELFEVGSVVHLPSYVFLDLLAKERSGADENPGPLEYAARAIVELRKKYPENLELLALETRNLCRAGEVVEVGKRLALQIPGMAVDNRFWRFRGWYHAALEQWEQARVAYEKALVLEPFDWNTQLELAALIRATKGIEASAGMQAIADAGKQLMMDVQQCPDLNRLEPYSLYNDMEAYFRMCGEDEIADRLRSRLAS